MAPGTSTGVVHGVIRVDPNRQAFGGMSAAPANDESEPGFGKGQEGAKESRIEDDE